MKKSLWLASLSLLVAVSTSACLEADPAEPSDPTEQAEPALSETEQHLVDACPESYGCILTALRDGNGWLVDTCIAVLCN